MPEYLDAGTIASWKAGDERARPAHGIRSLAVRLLHAWRISDIVSFNGVTRLGSAPNMKCGASRSGRRAYRPTASRVYSKGARS